MVIQFLYILTYFQNSIMSRKLIFLTEVTKNQINGDELPSKIYFESSFLQYTPCQTELHDNVSLVFDDCQILWIKSRIPAQGRSNCVNKIKKIMKNRKNVLQAF